MSCICLGPKRAGKTHLLKALQEQDGIDETSYSMPTIGTGIYRVFFPEKSSHGDNPKPPPTDAAAAAAAASYGKHLPKFIQILEIGGSMAPLWRQSQYFEDVKKLIYVVDASNLCQISAAGEWVEGGNLFSSLTTLFSLFSRRTLLLYTNRATSAEGKDSTGADQDGLFLQADAQRGAAHVANVKAAEADTPAGDDCGGQRSHSSGTGQHLRLAAKTLSRARNGI